MIKKLGVFFLCLLALSLSACAKKHHQPRSQGQAPTFTYADWKIEKQAFQENSEGKQQYHIKVEYPRVISYPDTAIARQVNQQIYAYVQDNLAHFKQTAPRESFDYVDYPPEMTQNYFGIHYSATLINPRGHVILSLRFETETRLHGEITHLHHFMVMNYDLSTGQRLTLDSLFRPGSPYLETLANQCTKQLRKRFTSDMPWMPWNMDGSLPQEQNFQIWNLQRNGLVITFQEYQVTPYSSQPQKIVIPYSRLRPILSPESPVSAYAYM